MTDSLGLKGHWLQQAPQLEIFNSQSSLEHQLLSICDYLLGLWVHSIKEELYRAASNNLGNSVSHRHTRIVLSQKTSCGYLRANLLSGVEALSTLLSAAVFKVKACRLRKGSIFKFVLVFVFSLQRFLFQSCIGIFCCNVSRNRSIDVFQFVLWTKHCIFF